MTLHQKTKWWKIGEWGRVGFSVPDLGPLGKLLRTRRPVHHCCSQHVLNSDDIDWLEQMCPIPWGNSQRELEKKSKPPLSWLGLKQTAITHKHIYHKC